MKAVIPCAGEGVRMRPLTLRTPKQLLEVGGKPILVHIFENLPDEIDEVILVVGYLGDKIREYFGDEFLGRKIAYVEQPAKLGTADALWRCREFLGVGKFLMLYGDDIIDKQSITKCLKREFSILVRESEHPERFGVIVTDNNGKITDLIEKPEKPISNIVSTGVKVLDERIFNYPATPHPNGEYYITSSLAQFIKEHDVFVERAAVWIPIGNSEDLARANEHFKDLAGKV